MNEIKRNQRSKKIQPNKKVIAKTTKRTKKDLEFEKYLEKIERPDYPWVAKGCPENPTTLERLKYDACQDILGYKLTHHLTTQQIAKKIHLPKEETQKVLFCWIENFTLDELITYADLLFAPSQIKINIEKSTEKKPKRSAIHV